MKLLYWHTKSLKIEVGKHTKKEVARLRERLGDALPELGSNNRQIEASNALLVFVCVEKGDEKIELSEVQKDILRARALLGVSEIVMSAFAHLSPNTAEPLIARKMIDDLAALVEAEHTVTKTIPFGWDKTLTLQIDVPSHRFNAAFRSFDPAIGNVWDEIAGDYHLYMIRTGHYEAQFRLLDALQKHVRGYVLDVACGAGEVVRYLHARQHGMLEGYIGVDSSESMIELAKKNGVFGVLYDDSHTSFIHGKIEEIIGLFDTILLLNGAAYVDLEKLLGQLPNMMAPNAKLIIGEENPFVPEFLEGQPPRIKKQLGEIKRRTTGELMRLITAKSFRQIDETQITIDEKHGLVGLVFNYVAT